VGGLVKKKKFKAFIGMRNFQFRRRGRLQGKKKLIIPDAEKVVCLEETYKKDKAR